MKTVVEELIDMINNRTDNSIKFNEEEKISWLEKEKSQCIDFGLHLENLPPIKKFTVHPPDGSGGSTGLYEKTIEQLLNEYKNTKQ